MAGMPIHLVTGGAGFIGSHIVETLVRRGDRVRVLDDLSTGRLENLAGLGVGAPGSGAAVELVRGSITDPDACRIALEGVVGVFHEAAQVSVPRSFEDPLRSYEINVMGTLRMLEAAQRSGVRTFVFASSSAVYGDSPVLPKEESMPPRPLSPYACGKLAGEDLVRVYGEARGMRTVSLRYFNVFGPRQADDSPYTGVIAIFARALLQVRRATILGDGGQTRDFTYIEDAVRANLLASEADVEPGTVINVGGGERVSIAALQRSMAEIAGSSLEPLHAPARQGDVRDSLASLERARARLRWSPEVPWRKGLVRTMAWYRERLATTRA